MYLITSKLREYEIIHENENLSKSIEDWNKVVYKNKINLTSHEVQTEMEKGKFDSTTTTFYL